MDPEEEINNLKEKIIEEIKERMDRISDDGYYERIYHTDNTYAVICGRCTACYNNPHADTWQWQLSDDLVIEGSTCYRAQYIVCDKHITDELTIEELIEALKYVKEHEKELIKEGKARMNEYKKIVKELEDNKDD